MTQQTSADGDHATFTVRMDEPLVVLGPGGDYTQSIYPGDILQIQTPIKPPTVGQSFALGLAMGMVLTVLLGLLLLIGR